MPVEFTRSWNDEEVERFRESWVRFVETEMQPQDAEARKRGHVGHELWRRAGELGFLCVDIPVEGAAPAVTSGIRRYCMRRWRAARCPACDDRARGWFRPAGDSHARRTAW